MSVLPVGFGSSGGYIIENSVRLRASASAYFSKTFGSVGDRKTWTFHIRCKRGSLGSYQRLLSDSTNSTYLRFDTSDRLEWNYHDGISSNANTSTRKFRDPTAWLDIVLSCDTTQATSTNRWKIEVNGETLSAWDAGPSYTGTLNNAGCSINNNTAHYISGYAGTGEFFDGVVADIHFIGGARLSASDFGETNADGVWVPKPYAGSYSGTNSSHMDHADIAVTAGSNAGLGKDVSGNGNYWNTNNISVTAGVTYDALTDTPTNNFCTLNPLSTPSIGGALSEANLKYAGAASYTASVIRGSIGFPVGSGTWYWETTATEGGGSQFNGTGVCQFDSPISGSSLTGQWGYEWTSARYRMANGTETNEAASDLAAGDVICHAYNAATGYMWVRLNGGSWYQGVSGSSGDPAAGTNPSISGIPTTTQMFPYVQLYSRTHQINFGQRPFAYTPPTGFKSLCTANLPAVAITNPKKHFNAKTRTGTAATFSVTGELFQPGMVWTKGRSGATDHAIYDAVRGVEKRLETNNTDAEVTGDTTGLTAFNSDGFTGGALAQINTNAATYVDWMWKANGAGASNTAGSITSSVSANQAAGFSVVTYTGTGANATVGHGLGIAPKFIIIKRKDTAGQDWGIGHAALDASTPWAYYINFTTGARAASSLAWQDTAPTSTVFSIGTGSSYNTNTGSYIAYCFAEVPGYSKFGSYVGNGSTDGPFVFCGFRPRFILVKRSDAGAENWLLWDSSRMTYNVSSLEIKANLANAEADVAAANGWDQTSNGFKLRSGNSIFNTSTATYIYAAFAEHPFGGSNCAPAPAR